jgi:hypothetical protein
MTNAKKRISALQNANEREPRNELRLYFFARCSAKKFLSKARHSAWRTPLVMSHL